MSCSREKKMDDEDESVFHPMYMTVDLLKRASRGVSLEKVTSLILDARGDDKFKQIENLDRCPLLEHLSLSGHAIAVIEHMSRLSRLVSLNLSENCLVAMSGIERLVALEKLDVSGNCIEHIPAEIATLKRLRVLRLARNRLADLRDIVIFIFDDDWVQLLGATCLVFASLQSRIDLSVESSFS